MSRPRHQSAVPLVEQVPKGSCAPGRRWNMDDELAFLHGLGHWRKLKSVPDRAQLLRGYLEGLPLRRRWTDLQREALECEARFFLGQLEAGRSVLMSA